MRAVLGLLARAVLLLVLAVALLLSVLRLLEPPAGGAVRLVSFAPLALPAYVVVLLGSLLLASRRPAGRRRLAYGGALVALAGVALHAAWIAPAFVGRGPAAAEGAEPLVVMTANLFVGGADADDLVAAVRERDVDVLVVEEISMPLLAEAEAAGLTTLLPHSIGGPAGYDPVAGTMVLSRTPLGTPTPVATGHDSWLVDVEVPGGSLRVLAVHPVAPVDVGEWRSDHRVIAEAVASADPDVVLGDFNATADHDPMQALAAAGWRDVGDLADVGWQPTWPANGLGPVSSLIPPLVRIDHVLVGSRWAGLDSSTVQIADTDHLALVAEIAPRTRPGG